MKKRILSIMLVALISISLTACGGSESTEKTQEQDKAVAEQQAVENTEEVAQKTEEQIKAEEEAKKQAEIKAQEDAKRQAQEDAKKQQEQQQAQQSKPKPPAPKPPVQQAPPVVDRVPAGEQGVAPPVTAPVVQPTYTKAEMEAIVQRCIAYGKSLGMTFMEKATKDDSSWNPPATTQMAYKGDIEGHIKDGIDYYKSDNITHFGLQLEPVNPSLSPTVKQHWTVYVLMG